MSVQPSSAELLEAVRDFLERHALPALDGRNAFHARVAINVIDIVRRELELGPAAAAAAQARLVALLNAHAPEGQGDLERELCRRIRAGELNLDTPGLYEHLWETTLARLAIDQPTYRALAINSEKAPNR